MTSAAPTLALLSTVGTSESSSTDVPPGAAYSVIGVAEDSRLHCVGRNNGSSRQVHMVELLAS